eukprot:jgi/Hompol1/2071/HPOL_002812-RA
MVYKSTLPDIQIPETDAASFVLYSEAFEANLDKPVCTDGFTGDTLTFEELRGDSQSFAGGLVNQLGFKKWDVLGIYSTNSVYYSTLVFGTLLAGGTVTTANAAYTVDELAYQLKDSGASILVVGAENVANGKAAAKEAGIADDRIFVISADPVDGVPSVFDLYDDEPAPKVEFTADELANKPAYLTYSSGTTGRSKGVQTTHRNMIANVLQVHFFFKPEITYGDTWAGALPFFHMYGLNILLHLAPYAGVHIAVLPKFDFLLLLETVQTHKVVMLFIVPPIIVGLAKHPIVDSLDLSSVRRIISGAAPLAGEIAEAASKRLGATIVQGYGLTETSPVSALCPLDKPVHGSIGILSPSMDARIVDPDTGADVGYNTPGELWLRGPNIMKAYHNNPQATQESIDEEGYFHTGDVATISEDGHIYIVDRLKELIKYTGLQVPPAELEAKLLSHSKIADAAVVGRAEETVGEVPVAFVVLKPGQTATEEEIVEFVAERVASHKQLRGGVIFTDSIPKAASGKILRRILRQRLADQQ